MFAYQHIKQTLFKQPPAVLLLYYKEDIQFQESSREFRAKVRKKAHMIKMSGIIISNREVRNPKSIKVISADAMKNGITE